MIPSMRPKLGTKVRVATSLRACAAPPPRAPPWPLPPLNSNPTGMSRSSPSCRTSSSGKVRFGILVSPRSLRPYSYVVGVVSQLEGRLKDISAQGYARISNRTCVLHAALTLLQQLGAADSAQDGLRPTAETNGHRASPCFGISRISLVQAIHTKDANEQHYEVRAGGGSKLSVSLRSLCTICNF